MHSCLPGDFWSSLPTLVGTGNLTGLSPPDTHCVGLVWVPMFPLSGFPFLLTSSCFLSKLAFKESSRLLPLLHVCIKSCSTLRLCLSSPLGFKS